MNETAFETAQEAADRLGVTVRAVQKWAAAGRIPDSVKSGRSWKIPKNAVILESELAPRAEAEINGIPDVYQITPFRVAMPLLNSSYPVGKCMEYIHTIPDPDDRNIALAEYYFFSGRSEDASYIKNGYTGDTACTECESILDEGEIIPKLVAPDAGYDDVPDEKWYSDAVNYMIEKGLMVGTSDTEFSPEYNCTRAMVVTVLYRLAGSPDAAGLANPFTDVKEGVWYYNAVIWTVNNDIVSGVTTTQFAPSAIVTREQFVTILYRYNGSPEADTDLLDSFPDAEEVCGYAENAMAWAVEEGLIQGSLINGELYLLPEASATRAQIATIFMWYLESCCKIG